MGMPTNEVGNWHQYRAQLQAVRDLNQKPHRKQDIRNLTPYIILSGDKSLVDKYTQGIRSFPDRLPFSFEGERHDEGHVAQLREQMKLYVEQGDPQFWKTAPTPDGKHVQFFNDSPTLKTEKY
jgi:hypothetical protein